MFMRLQLVVLQPADARNEGVEVPRKTEHCRGGAASEPMMVSRTREAEKGAIVRWWASFQKDNAILCGVPENQETWLNNKEYWDWYITAVAR